MIDAVENMFANKASELIIGVLLGAFLALCLFAVEERKSRIAFAHEIVPFTVYYYKRHGYYPSYQIQKEYATSDGLDEKIKLLNKD